MRRLTVALAAVIFIFGVHIILGQEVSAASPEMVLRSRFITRFESSGPARRTNIRLAAAAIDRKRFAEDEEGSFNEMTGERSAAKGYREAKIIYNGEYVAGVGGGVCQVSTTLYNALLLADVEVTEAHKHTIRSSYVEPSFDAMVDYGSADLRFVNRTGAAIMIRAAARGDDLVVEVYGSPMGYTVKRVSEIVKVFQPEPPQVIPDEKGEYQDKVIYLGERYVLRRGSSGCFSRGYLVKIQNGVSRTLLIRSDYYAPVRGLEIEGTLAGD